MTRKERQKALARYAVDPTDTRTLTEVGRELYPNAKAYPAQTVYNALKQPGTKAEIAKLQPTFSLQKLDQKTEAILDRRKTDGLTVKAIEMGYKRHGAFREANQNQDNRRITVNIGVLTGTELHSKVLEAVRMAAQGQDIDIE